MSRTSGLTRILIGLALSLVAALSLADTVAAERPGLRAEDGFGNVVTPTMVMTGEHDWRTPISEFEQYYTALKLKGVETVLVRVPGEPHGIRVRPSHHVAKMLNIVGWFDRYDKQEEQDDDE